MINEKRDKCFGEMLTAFFVKIISYALSKALKLKNN